MKFFEDLFEGSLWNSRFVIFLAVLGSLFASFAIFYMATVDVVILVQHTLHYADSSLTDEARKVLHDSTVSHIVEVVDGYLGPLYPALRRHRHCPVEAGIFRRHPLRPALAGYFPGRHGISVPALRGL